MKTLAQGGAKLRLILEMIKFEHTLFALPFALMSMMLAADGLPAGRTIGWILVAMVGARSCAMAFNRLVDQEFDRLNPRTAGRALPAGLLKRSQVWVFTVVTGGLLVLAAWQLNPLALALSPVALAVICGYSFTKRFTDWSHLVLGLALAIAPVGAWIAVRGEFGWPSLVLAAAVTLWVAGFDVIYACQDVGFDRRIGLHSLPQRFGIGPALWISRALHLCMVSLLVALYCVADLHLAYLIGVAVVAALLAYEQSLVKPHDLSRVNAAFFTLNGFVSVGLLLFTAVDVWVWEIGKLGN
jgi:4-hydroxybenzoate polyprenyltransferase